MAPTPSSCRQPLATGNLLIRQQLLRNDLRMLTLTGPGTIGRRVWLSTLRLSRSAAWRMARSSDAVPPFPCRHLECQLEPSSRSHSWARARRRCSWQRSRSLKPLVQAALPRGNSATKLARVIRLGPRRWRPIGTGAPRGHERARVGRDGRTGRDDPDRFGTRPSEARRPQAQSSVRYSSRLRMTRSRTCASIRRSGAVAGRMGHSGRRLATRYRLDEYVRKDVCAVGSSGRPARSIERQPSGLGNNQRIRIQSPRSFMPFDAVCFAFCRRSAASERPTAT
jgi:hypothetical protein